MSLEDPIKSTLDGLLEVLKMENVIGVPIESDGKMLIPVARVGLGFGAGMGQGESSMEGKGSQGTGAGGGATVEPIAFVIVDKNAEGPEQIQVLPIAPQEPVNKAISEFSELAMELLKEWQKRQKKNEEEMRRRREQAEDLYTP